MQSQYSVLPAIGLEPILLLVRKRILNPPCQPFHQAGLASVRVEGFEPSSIVPKTIALPG